MAKEEISLNLKICGESYTFICDSQDKEIILEVADMLNSRYNDIRSKQSNLSREKMVIFCALDLARSLRRDREVTSKDIVNANQISEKLNAALDMALSESRN